MLIQQMQEVIIVADLNTNNLLKVVDKRRGRGTTVSPINMANMDDVSSMRARLTAISNTSYTTARLNAMSTNDMVYAIRLNDELAGI